MKGSKEIGGRMMSDTNELTTAVNAAASLMHCQLMARSVSSSIAHQTDSDFEHVVTESKVCKIVPGTRDALPCVLTGVQESLATAVKL